MSQAAQYAEEWLAGYPNPNTRRAYEKDVGDFLGWCEDQELDPLTVRRAHGNQLISHLLEQGRTNQTVHRKLAAVRQFYEFLVLEEELDRNPFRLVKFRWLRSDSSTPWLTEDELRALLVAAAKTTTPLRDFVLCGLLGLNGLRIGEVHKARIEDLGTTGGQTILWVMRKGGKRTRIPLDPRLAAVIDNYLVWVGRGEPPSEGPLVVSADTFARAKRPLRPIEKVAAGRRIKEIARTAHVNPDISPHSLRHSFATLALGKSVPLHYVQAAMGHANPATTMYYNRDADNLQNHPTSLICDLMFGGMADQLPGSRPELDAGEQV